MGLPRKIKEDIYCVGAIDWDRRLFDELIPLPDGTSYNAYLIKGSERTALIDTVDPTKEEVLVNNLKKLKSPNIDYIIANHAEQDHSGTLPRMLRMYPDARVITNEKCKRMLVDLLLIPEEKFMVIEDGNTVSLGDKKLQFMNAPWVHWPETMFTYLMEENILFTCDFLGSHLATSSLYASNDEEKVYNAAKRYYAEIMMPFRRIIPRHLDRIDKVNTEIIAPSHGPIYDKPGFILNAYRDWVSGKVKNEVIVAFVSMHGSTRKMVNYLIDALIKKDIKVIPYNLTRTDIGELAMNLVDAATIVVATPTVLTGPHPAAVYASYLVNVLRPKLKFASIIGSFGWGGKMPEQIKETLTNLKIELLNPVVARGYPKEEDFKALEKLANTIQEKHKEVISSV